MSYTGWHNLFNNRVKQIKYHQPLLNQFNKGVILVDPFITVTRLGSAESC